MIINEGKKLQMMLLKESQNTFISFFHEKMVLPACYPPSLSTPCPVDMGTDKPIRNTVVSIFMS